MAVIGCLVRRLIDSGLLLGPSSCLSALSFLVAVGAMLNLSNRTVNAVRTLDRVANGMATAVPRISDQNVSISVLEKGALLLSHTARPSGLGHTACI